MEPVSVPIILEAVIVKNVKNFSMILSGSQLLVGRQMPVKVSLVYFFTFKEFKRFSLFIAHANNINKKFTTE